MDTPHASNNKVYIVHFGAAGYVDLAPSSNCIGTQLSLYFCATSTPCRLLNDGVDIITFQVGNPPGLPYAFAVVGAVVPVLQSATEVIGAVVYVEGTRARRTYQLKAPPLRCPLDFELLISFVIKARVLLFQKQHPHSNLLGPDPRGICRCRRQKLRFPRLNLRHLLRKSHQSA